MSGKKKNQNRWQKRIFEEGFYIVNCELIMVRNVQILELNGSKLIQVKYSRRFFPKKMGYLGIKSDLKFMSITA